MSSESKTALFKDPSNNALLRRVSADVEMRADELTKPQGLYVALGNIVNLMISNPDKFDEFCSVNIEWIGKYFIGQLSDLLKAPAEQRLKSAQSAFTLAYRFLCELEFTQPGDPSFEVSRIMSFVHDNLEEFEGTHRQQLVYAAYTMPAQVAKRLIRHPSISDFRSFSQAVEESRKLKENWDADLGKRQALLQGLSDGLKKITSEYNFVGLVDGFKRLRLAKLFEQRVAFWGLLVVGALMIVLPAAKVTFVILNLEEIEKHRFIFIYSLPTIIAIEVILLYFFRVILSQFRSVKTQLLQIDLRISLCQFVESYADYVSKIREKDSSALGKFEALIFSGLVTDETGIPSTFDGVEQIASLIRSLRGAAKE